MREESYGGFSERIFFREEEIPTPVKAHFEITYRCNLRCVHCYTDPFNTPQDVRRELALDEITRLLDDLARAGVLWLTLSGGEAFAHPQFREIYKAARARGFVVSVLSNATLVTDSLIAFLKDDPPFQLEVSMHGAGAGVFNRVTQVPGSYERFRGGIEKIRAAGLPLRLKTNALTLNREELPEIKAFVESLGLSFSLDSAIHPRLNGDISSTNYRLPAREILELEYGGMLDGKEGLCSRSYENTTPSPGLRPTSPQGEVTSSISPLSLGRGQGEGVSKDKLFRCGCGTTSVTINPYGILRACTFTTWPSYDLRTLSVSDAFQKLSAEIRAACYTGESPCRRCVASDFCDKNPVTARYEAGSMEAPVPHFCDVAFGRLEREEVWR